MFGYLRFLLAFLVLLSHANIRFFSLNFGVVAVVIFYILSGYVVSHLLRDLFFTSHRSFLDALILFYKDRIKRIFPLYLFVCTITLLFLLLTSYANPSYSFMKLLNNALIIPLNYYMYIDSNILTEPSWQLIPPAWSLGTELQAYLLLPFALLFFRTRVILSIISFAFYIVANLSLLHPDYFGYRFLAGVFFIFLAGSAIQRFQKEDKLYLFTLYLSLIIFTLFLSLKGTFSPTYTKETLIGLLVGIPLIIAISRKKISLPFEAYLADLSYAIFLTHFLSIWILDYFSISSSQTLIYLFQLSSLTLLLSALSLWLTPAHHKNIKTTKFLPLH